ncbi:MAG: antibiotic biosynthesis monooxygenase [Sedimenticola sp.]
MMPFAETPEPPYYAVIFASVLSDDAGDYPGMAARMLELARQQPGFLGVESARDTGLGITVSYWKDEASIHQWRDQVEHVAARKMGREKWYAAYSLRVARVERDYRLVPSD